MRAPGAAPPAARRGTAARAGRRSRGPGARARRGRRHRPRRVPEPAASSSSAPITVSGTNRPPNSPKRPRLVGQGRAHAASFALRTNALDQAGSLMPGSASTPRAVSTAHGRAVRTASATLSGSRLPASITGARTRAARCQCARSASSSGASRVADRAAAARRRAASAGGCAAKADDRARVRLGDRAVDLHQVEVIPRAGVDVGSGEARRQCARPSGAPAASSRAHRVVDPTRAGRDDA